MKGYVVLISIVAALGGLLFGFDTAVISGTINFIQPYFGLSEAGVGWTVSSLLFGCIAGVFIAGKAGDHYGRKKVLMLAALLFFVSAVGSASAQSLIFFLIARILGGTIIKKCQLPELEAGINKLLKANELSGDDLSGIGFSFAGLVDSHKNKIISTNQKYDDGPETDLAGWAKFNWNCLLFAGNDARMALLGEWQYGHSGEK